MPDTNAPYHCDLIHVAYRTVEEKHARWAQVAEWIANDSWPELMPEWVLQRTLNHGGGGGP